MGPMLLSVVSRCPLYGGVNVCRTQFWDSNICPSFGGVRCIEVSVDGGSTVLQFKEQVVLFILQSGKQGSINGVS